MQYATSFNVLHLILAQMGEHLRGEQPVGPVATCMARIDLGQFCEPMPERMHDLLLL